MTNQSSQQVQAQREAINQEKAALQHRQASLQAEEMRWELLHQVYRQGITRSHSAGFIAGTDSKMRS